MGGLPIGEGKYILNWTTTWRRLCELGENDFEEVLRETGVYVLRCVDFEGKLIKIPRGDVLTKKESYTSEKQ